MSVERNNVSLTQKSGASAGAEQKRYEEWSSLLPQWPEKKRSKWATERSKDASSRGVAVFSTFEETVLWIFQWPKKKLAVYE